MKPLILFLFFLLNELTAAGQLTTSQTTIKNENEKGNTYALIIGISNYENKNIPNLNYSNRDAEVFSDYLKSSAGGSVPAENIRLLIDTNATTASIYNSLKWLKEKCEEDKDLDSKKDNTIFFYFSGHGDLESETINELGFLLSFNTPSNNYINNAVRLEDLNYYANTLSAKFNAKVILITDACHSGKLAGGDNRYLVGKELSAAKKNEIRITSCEPKELSNENIGWGGGRSVFSYYLLNGLRGLADSNKDSSITLNEIRKYIDSSIRADAIMKENNLKQNPVLNGDENFKLAKVNNTQLLLLQQMALPAKPIESNQQYFFSLLKQRDRLESLNFEKINSLSAAEIPFGFIKQLKESGDTTIQVNRITALEKTIQTDKEALQLFIETLVETLHTSGQKVINLYLEGDAAELERRRYYNTKSSGYDMYPSMYAITLKLVPPDNPLTQILKVNQYYFTGLAARLKIPLVEEVKQSQLLKVALAAQTKALALQEDAANIHNELGILAQTQRQNDTAEKYFLRATELSPDWAIPWANLSGLYAGMKKFDQALQSAKTADSLQADLHTTNTALGFTYEKSGNLLFAEEFYRKAIDINSRHYYPFERLGYVYMNTTKYAAADSFFHEADIRKKGYHFNGNGFDLSFLMSPMLPEAFKFCNLDTAVLNKDDIMAFFYWGHQLYQKKDYTNAVRVFKKIIAVDKSNPLVFHYMGKIFFDQQKWEDAEVMFKFATKYYLNDDRFKMFCDSVITKSKFSYQHDCFEEYFREHQYSQVEDPYFLANMYEAWAHYEEAESTYKNIMLLIPGDIAPYIKIWQLQEKLGRYAETEKTIQSYALYNKEAVIFELNEFYKRAIAQFPEEGSWSHKLGLLLYDRANKPAFTTYLDTIVYFPLINKEVFIDFELHNKLNRTPEMLLDNKSKKGAGTNFTELKQLQEETKFIKIPGTNEIVRLANQLIYTPRKDAITYLLLADSLLRETEVLADINFKIGNVYVWAGSKKQAYAYYDKSIKLIPENASARMNMVDISKAIYKNRTALENLVYLYDHQKINFDHRLVLAEFYIHAGEFTKGKKVAEEAQTIYPYPVPATNDLMGRLHLLSLQPLKAIPFYKNYLSVNPDDPNTTYSIAKLYAQTGNSKEALKWLETAIKKGFNYTWVLKFDTAWDIIRKTATWNSLTKSIKPIKYDTE